MTERYDPLDPPRCAQMLAALAAPERLRIVRYLRNGAKNVGAIAEMLDTAPVNVSHHLSVLKHAGIIEGDKQGRFIYYALRPGLFQDDDELDGIEHLNLGCCRLEVPRFVNLELDEEEDTVIEEEEANS